MDAAVVGYVLKRPVASIQVQPILLTGKTVGRTEAEMSRLNLVEQIEDVVSVQVIDCIQIRERIAVEVGQQTARGPLRPGRACLS